jgi:hypothetical protein
MKAILAALAALTIAGCADMPPEDWQRVGDAMKREGDALNREQAARRPTTCAPTGPVLTCN